MNDQFVSFETAKLAKEKGFNWKVRHYFYDDFHQQTILKDKPTDYSQHKKGLNYECVGCPTQTLLQKWLREIYNIDLWAQPYVYKQSLPDESYSYFLYKDGVLVNDGADFLDFEEALEKGLLDALHAIIK